MSRIPVRVRLLIVLLSLLFLVGCKPIEYDTGIPTTTVTTQTIGRTARFNPIIRYVDEDAGMVCYVPYTGRAIFCLPLDETTLDR